jgi:hypothetical protein
MPEVQLRAPAKSSHQAIAWVTGLGGVFVACFFLFFTWRGLLVYYTGDDLMNLYGYWTHPVSALIKANIFFWTPFYRPFGAVIYRPLFSIFGFNPYPEYVIYYAAMLANLWLAYRLFARLATSPETSAPREIGAIAVLVWAFHGKFDYLYYNGGSLYDVFCFLFFSSALLIYLRARSQGRFLGLWGTIGFLACFICSLNSKEMAVTLPAILFLYELLFHPPDFRAPNFHAGRALVRWCLREGRIALVSAVCVLIYLPAKLGANGIAQNDAYMPSYTLSRWQEDMGTFLGYIFYRDHPGTPLDVTPVSPLGILLFFAILLAIALWLRSRVALFGLLFFAVAALPVSFIPARLGFVLYMPFAGLALYAAVCLVRFKQSLGKVIAAALGEGIPAWRTQWPVSSVALFLATAALIGTIDYRNWPPAPPPENSAYKNTASEFARLYPKLPHGSRLLFVHTALDSTWDMVFLLRIFYHDPDLFLTELNGPPAQRIPLNKLPRYDHIFDYVDGHYVELDNSDPVLSIKLHILKNPNPTYAFGETMTAGKPGVSQYIVKDVLAGDGKATGYWTLDQPELQFRLASLKDHIFRERFFLPRETLQKTGPLVVDFYVNGHHLDQARFAKDGVLLYEHPVPQEWLKIDDVTLVRMLVHNPYIAPSDHTTRLGFVLLSAGFSPIATNL